MNPMPIDFEHCMKSRNAGGFNVRDLKQIAKELGITGYSRMNKEPLCRAIIEKLGLTAFPDAPKTPPVAPAPPAPLPDFPAVPTGKPKPAIAAAGKKIKLKLPTKKLTALVGDFEGLYLIITYASL